MRESGCYWHPVGGNQEGCSTAHMAESRLAGIVNSGLNGNQPYVCAMVFILEPGHMQSTSNQHKTKTWHGLPATSQADSLTGGWLTGMEKPAFDLCASPQESKASGNLGVPCRVIKQHEIHLHPHPLPSYAFQYWAIPVLWKAFRKIRGRAVAGGRGSGVHEAALPTVSATVVDVLSSLCFQCFHQWNAGVGWVTLRLPFVPKSCWIFRRKEWLTFSCGRPILPRAVLERIS